MLRIREVGKEVAVPLNSAGEPKWQQATPECILL